MSRLIFLAVLVGLALLWGGADGLAHAPPHRGTPPVERQAIYHRAPRFTLITQGGQPLALQDLTGKVILVNFIYTSCPDVCPLATAKFRRVQQLLQARGLQERVYLLSISTDPAIDTPAVLRRYGRAYGADFSFWAFLTGTPGELSEVWEGFGVVTVARGRGDIDHTAMTYLLDRTGRIRLIYLGYGWREEDVAGDIARVLEQG